jgi:hypothetical protein
VSLTQTIAFSSRVISFLLARALVGTGSAGILCGAYTITGSIIHPRYIPVVIGVLGAFLGIGLLFGLLLVGVTDIANEWRAVLLLNIFFACLPMFNIVLFMVLGYPWPHQYARSTKSWQERMREMDSLGFSALILFTASVLLDLEAIDKFASLSHKVSNIVLFVLAVSIITFAGRELYKGRNVMFVWRLLKNRMIWVSMLFSFFITGSFFIILDVMPVYYRNVSGSSISDSETKLALIIAPAILASLSSGFVASKLDHYKSIFASGAGLMTAGLCLQMALLHSFNTQNTIQQQPQPNRFYVCAQILIGLGFGICALMPIAAVQLACTKDDIPSATAMILCELAILSSASLSN